MEELLTIALIVFLLIPAPLLIAMHFISKWKQSREIGQSEERMLEDSWLLSRRLEERLESLETILDGALPNWRRRI